MNMPLNKLGMREKAKAGTFPGRAPLGYKNVRLTLEEAWIGIDPKTASLAKEAFRSVAKGKPDPLVGRDRFERVQMRIAKRQRRRNIAPALL